MSHSSWDHDRTLVMYGRSRSLDRPAAAAQPAPKQVLPFASASASFKPASPSLPALVVDDRDAEVVPDFRKRTFPWALAVGAAATVFTLVAWAASEAAPRVADRVTAAAQAPAAEVLVPPAAQDLPPPIPATAEPAPPPHSVANAKEAFRGKHPDQGHAYDAKVDPAMRFHAPESWLGPAPPASRRAK